MSSTDPTAGTQPGDAQQPVAESDLGFAVTPQAPADDETGDVWVTAGSTGQGHGLLARAGAEMIGTFAVVLAVVGTLLYTGLSGAGAVGVALAGGAALAGMTVLFAHVSGAHLNPAVSVAAGVAGRTSWTDVLAYVGSQLLGAAVAVAVLFVTVPQALPGLVDATTPDATAADFLSATANGWGAGSPLSVLSGGQVSFGIAAALVIEAIGAGVLAAVVLGRRTAGRGTGGGVAVGLTYAAMLLVAGPVTNAGLNPARSTAVALLSAPADTLALSQLWAFWLAPVVGGALVGLAVLAFGTGPSRVELDLEEVEIELDAPVEAR